jgi:hypothetical protein
MFKILILQAWYGLSDEALEKQIARDLMFPRHFGCFVVVLDGCYFIRLVVFWLSYAKVSQQFKFSYFEQVKLNKKTSTNFVLNVEVYLVRFLLIFFTPIFLFSLTCSK